MRFQLESINPNIRILAAYRRRWNLRSLNSHLNPIGINFVLRPCSRTISLVDKITKKLEDHGSHDYEGFVELAFDRFYLPYFNQLLSDTVFSHFDVFYQTRLTEFVNRKISELERFVEQLSKYDYLVDDSYLKNPFVMGFLLSNKMSVNFHSASLDYYLRLAAHNYLFWPAAYEQATEENIRFLDRVETECKLKWVKREFHPNTYGIFLSWLLGTWTSFDSQSEGLSQHGSQESLGVISTS